MSDQVRSAAPSHDVPATAAGVYDALIGGTNHSPADREAATGLQQFAPEAAELARINRAFLRRAVRFLLTQGITQFLDLGSGILGQDSLHEIAQRRDSTIRVMYVDHDPWVVRQSQEILHDNAYAACIKGDITQPEMILNNRTVRSLLRLDEPVAVLMVSVVHFVQDSADPVRMVDTYKSCLVPESCLALTHATPGSSPGQVSPHSASKATRYNAAVGEAVTLRSHADIMHFFTGTELFAPGLVPASEWHPDGGYRPVGPLDGDGPVLLAGIGRVRA